MKNTITFLTSTSTTSLNLQPYIFIQSLQIKSRTMDTREEGNWIHHHTTKGRGCLCLRGHLSSHSTQRENIQSVSRIGCASRVHLCREICPWMIWWSQSAALMFWCFLIEMAYYQKTQWRLPLQYHTTADIKQETNMLIYKNKKLKETGCVDWVGRLQPRFWQQG